MTDLDPDTCANTTGGLSIDPALCDHLSGVYRDACHVVINAANFFFDL
jgi:hypothetical protein